MKGDAPTSLASTAGNAKVEVRKKGNTLVIGILHLKVNGLRKRDYFSVRSLCETIVTYSTCDPFKKLRVKCKIFYLSQWHNQVNRVYLYSSFLF